MSYHRTGSPYRTLGEAAADPATGIRNILDKANASAAAQLRAHGVPSAALAQKLGAVVTAQLKTAPVDACLTIFTPQISFLRDAIAEFRRLPGADFLFPNSLDPATPLAFPPSVKAPVANQITNLRVVAVAASLMANPVTVPLFMLACANVLVRRGKWSPDKLQQWFGAVGNQLSGAAKQAWDVAVQGAQAVLRGAGDAADAARRAAEQAAQAAGHAAEDVRQAGIRAAQAVWDATPPMLRMGLPRPLNGLEDGDSLGDVARFLRSDRGQKGLGDLGDDDAMAAPQMLGPVDTPVTDPATFVGPPAPGTAPTAPAVVAKDAGFVVAPAMIQACLDIIQMFLTMGVTLATGRTPMTVAQQQAQARAAEAAAAAKNADNTLPLLLAVAAGAFVLTRK